MSDVSITAANVVLAEGGKALAVTYGETITAGQPLYRDASDSGKAKKCINTSAAASNCIGIALCGGSSNQPGVVAYDGDITMGGTIVSGEIYAVSANAGGFAPEADVASGRYMTTLGSGISTTQVRLKINYTGAVL